MNKQKGFIPILMITGAIIIILGFIGGVSYLGVVSNKPQSQNPMITSSSLQQSPTPIPTSFSSTPMLTPTQTSMPAVSSTPTLLPTLTSTKLIHLYPAYGADPTVGINKIHTIYLLFEAKDINTSIKEEWYTNMNLIAQKLKKFYEKQFLNNIEITYKIVSQPVTGNKNLEDYSPYSLVQEVRDSTTSLVVNGAYNVWMVYVVRDPEFKKNVQGGNLGGVVTLQAATMGEFWLDNEAVITKNAYGFTGSAHEFGHALGIPHPWELPANVNQDPNFGNVPGDLMGYSSGNITLDSLYIRDDVKKTMGL